LWLIRNPADAGLWWGAATSPDCSDDGGNVPKGSIPLIAAWSVVVAVSGLP